MGPWGCFVRALLEARAGYRNGEAFRAALAEADAPVAGFLDFLDGDGRLAHGAANPGILQNKSRGIQTTFG
jgi:hypothetical protein